MIDETLLQTIDFEKQGGLVPAVVQDAENGQVLMLAYMSKESLKITIEKGLACYYSRSRNELWLKGETSGHYQHVSEIDVDCDQDTLLLKVIQEGAACHAEAGSYTGYLFEKGTEKILKKVGEECTEVVIASMKENNKEEIVNEIGDLIYHLFVLMADKDISLEDVNAELYRRSGKTGNLKPERRKIENY